MCKWVVLGVLLASASFAFAQAPAGPVAPPSDAPSPPAADPAAPPAAAAAASPAPPAADAPPVTQPDAAPAPSSPAAPAALAPPAPETPPDPDETPPLNGGRVLGEFAIGALFMVGGTIGGAYIGYSLETADGCGGDWCGFGGLVVGGLAGMAFVTPIGVYLVGNTDGETGSLGATIGGSVIGTLVGLGAAAAIDDDASVVVLGAGPVVGSILGFNLSRRYVATRRARTTWAPVANVRDGHASLGVVGRF